MEILEPLQVKYRPKDYATVVGQDSVVNILKGLRKGNGYTYSNSLIFYASAGSGKTTLSRIYAKSVNCLNPKDGEACNECEHCISFNRGDYPDFIEVDGASYGKVEDARILIDKLFNQYPIIPNGIRCVLVDECHRLSKQAWDLFLKPLEEGGTKTIFLFATTEFDKIPPAIVSRSIALRVLPCSADQILMQLEKICIAENIKFDKKALARIAYVFKNKMRDAIKTMDMYYKSFGEVTVVELENVEEKILEAVQLAYLSKIQECYKILDNLFIDEELHSILSSVFAAILLYPNVPDTHCGLSETLLQGFKQIVCKENVTEICKEYATLNPKSMQDFKMFCAIVASIGAKSMGSVKPVENGQIRVGRRFCNNFSKESYLTEQEKVNLANKSGWIV